jgi:prophage tail gpP-like protein
VSEVALTLDGTRHLGWTEVQIRSGLDQVASRFELALTERWAERQAPRPIQAGARCTLEIDGERVITGHVDDVLPDYDAETHRIVVSGRSLTADLVDCSGRRKTFEQPRKLEQVARELAQPFGIEVVVEVDTGEPLRAPAVEPGQPFYEALEQLARYRGVLLVTDPQGRLVITKPPRGRLREALVLGENIRRGSGRFTVRDRFSQLIVQGQQPANDFMSGTAASKPEGVAEDEGVRYRPMLVLADTAVDTASCRQRARAEVRRRRGRARGVTYTVSGWRHRSGLWEPGYLVQVRDRWLGVDAWRLIESVQLLLDDQGERAELRVVPQEAWDLQAEPEPQPEPEAWG